MESGNTGSTAPDVFRFNVMKTLVEIDGTKQQSGRNRRGKKRDV
ncbi:hypothetical protein LINPERHAP2_LOCUS34545 [Linum perenne]